MFHGLGGKLLLEINRILRPGGYFIISSKHGDLESEEGMLKFYICRKTWNDSNFDAILIYRSICNCAFPCHVCLSS